jgi:hypothetical protein
LNNYKILFGITATIITTILTISLETDPIQAKSTDSWYDLEKKKNWEVAGPFDFGIKIPSNWAWQKVYYEPDKVWHQNNAIEMYPNDMPNQTVVYAMIATDGHYQMKNSALNTYVNYKKDTPDWFFLGNPDTRDNNIIKLLSETDITISDQPAKKLEYQTILNFKLAMYLTMYNGEPYIGIFQAKSAYYDQYITEFEKILQSLTFVDDEEEEEEEFF